MRIAGAEVIEVQLGIVGARDPRHAAAVRHRVLIRPALRARLTLAGRGVPAPHEIAALRIARLEVAGDVERVAADADDHLLADDHRRVGREVLALHVGDLVMPPFLARRHVERDEVVVGREEIQPVVEDADAAVADVVAAARLPGIVPGFPAGARIERPDVIRHRQVQVAVDHERRRLDRRRTAPGRRRVGPFSADDRAGARRVEAVDPRQREVLHVGRVDLLERAVAPARVVAVVGRPGVGGNLRGERQRRHADRDHQGCLLEDTRWVLGHFRLAR